MGPKTGEFKGEEKGTTLAEGMAAGPGAHKERLITPSASTFP